MLELIIVLIVIIIWYLSHNNTASFTVNKPRMYQQIIEHQDLFDGSNYSQLKSQLPWLDASIYSDVKRLRLTHRALTTEHLTTVF